MNDKERNKLFRAERKARLQARTRIQRDARAEITRLLKEADAKIQAKLAAAPSDFAAWYLPQAHQAVQQAINELSNQAATNASNASNQSWQAGVDLIDQPIAAGGIPIASYLPQIDTAQLLAMRAFLTTKIKDVTLGLANKINSEIGLAAIGAQSPTEAISRISDLLKSTRSRAITTYRTELGRVFSTAAQQRYSQASEYLPGLQKQWRRSGKTHSRPEHDAADGQIQPVDQPFIIHTKRGPVKLMYPRDPKGPAAQTINCGCESIPHMAHWNMTNPGRKPFSKEELASAAKQALADAKPING